MARVRRADAAVSVDSKGRADQSGDCSLERHTAEIEAMAWRLFAHQKLPATLADQGWDAEPERLLASTGETIGGLTCSLHSPSSAEDAAIPITQTIHTRITGGEIPNFGNLALMCNCDGNVTIGCAWMSA